MMSKLVDESKNSLAELQKIMVDFVSRRNWWKYHTPKNLAISISLESSELLEHFQWESPDPSIISSDTRKAIGEEMADILAYLLSLSHVLNIDLVEAFYEKMLKNEKKYPVEKFQGIWKKN